MRDLQGYTALIVGGVALAAALVSYYVLGTVLTKLILDILLLGAAVIVSWTWAPAAFQAAKNGARSAAHKIILTVWTSWSALLIQRLYVLGLSASGRPKWLLNSPVPIVVATLILIAGGYAAYATISEPDVPIQERRHVLFASFLGGLVVGSVLASALIFGFTF